MQNFNVVLYDDFETLDVFGPVEIIGKLPDLYDLKYYSLNGGVVTSTQKVQVNTKPFSDIYPSGVLLIPGGSGTRTLVDDKDFIAQLKLLAEQAGTVFGRLYRGCTTG